MDRNAEMLFEYLRRVIYAPSCPVMPVIRAVFVIEMFVLTVLLHGDITSRHALSVVGTPLPACYNVYIACQEITRLFRESQTSENDT